MVKAHLSHGHKIIIKKIGYDILTKDKWGGDDEGIGNWTFQKERVECMVEWAAFCMKLFV